MNLGLRLDYMPYFLIVDCLDFIRQYIAGKVTPEAS
jgi:hypothetical protein